MAEYLTNTADLTAVADAIRAKGGTAAQLVYPSGFVSAIQAIETGAVEVLEWHQCPELVRNYLENVTYNPADYSTSQIVNYAPATAAVSNYKPIGQEAGGVMHYNEVPNILTPFAGTDAAGTLKPLDALRCIRTRDNSA